MKRILFVDDEQRVLDALQRMLRSKRSEWDLVFAIDGRGALEAFAKAPFDVIVTDMRMPGMDGAALLSAVQQSHPETIRIILSGQTDRASAIRAAGVAHQYLSKPTDPQTLIDTIERASHLRSTLRQPAIRELLGGIDSLPAVPRLYTELLDVLDSADPSLELITSIVSQDVAMSAKILQLANSPVFGVTRQVTTLHGAIALLGVSFLKNLVITAEVFHGYERVDGSAHEAISTLQKHSVLVAEIAANLIPERALAESAFIAGMLHDIGHLVLMDRLPEKFMAIRRAAAERGVPIHEVEQEVLGVTHTQIGAYLLTMWGLPDQIVEAVAFHHTPCSLKTTSSVGPLLVHVADALAHEVAPSPAGGALPALQINCLQQISIGERLDEWRILASQRSASIDAAEGVPTHAG